MKCQECGNDTAQPGEESCYVCEDIRDAILQFEPRRTEGFYERLTELSYGDKAVCWLVLFRGWMAGSRYDNTLSPPAVPQRLNLESQQIVSLRQDKEVLEALNGKKDEMLNSLLTDYSVKRLADGRVWAPDHLTDEVFLYLCPRADHVYRNIRRIYARWAGDDTNRKLYEEHEPSRGAFAATVADDIPVHGVPRRQGTRPLSLT